MLIRVSDISNITVSIDDSYKDGWRGTVTQTVRKPEKPFMHITTQRKLTEEELNSQFIRGLFDLALESSDDAGE